MGKVGPTPAARRALSTSRRARSATGVRPAACAAPVTRLRAVLDASTMTVAPPRRAPLVVRADVPRREVPVERFAVPLLAADERREVPLLPAPELLAVERLGALRLLVERFAVERLPEERDDDEPRDDELRPDFGCGMNLSPWSDARDAIAEDKRASSRVSRPAARAAPSGRGGDSRPDPRFAGGGRRALRP